MKSLLCELRKYKTLIIVYVSICMVTAVFVSPLFGLPDASIVSASEFGGDVSVDDTFMTLSDMFTKQAFNKIAGAYAPTVGACCEPFAAFLFIGVIDLINRYAAGNILNVQPTILGNPVIVGIVLVFFIASKIMKGNAATKLFGICTLGELEKYLGLAFCIVIGIVNVVGLTNYFTNNTVNAAGFLESVNNSTFLRGTFAAFVSVLMAVGSVIIYIIVKTVFFGIDALQSCFSFIPASSAIFEICKTIFTIAITAFNLACPQAALFVDLIVLLICLFLFNACLRIEEYLRKIYIRPFIQRLKGYNDEIPLVAKKLPKKIKNHVEKEYGEVTVAIPAFCFKDKEADNFKMKFMKKLWIVATDNQTLFVHKNLFGKISEYKLTNREDDKMYFYKQDFRFLEIFSNPKGAKLFRKDMRIVFSVEYLGRITEIVELLKITDYKAFVADNKLSKKQQRRAKNRERIENASAKIKGIGTNIGDFVNEKILRKPNRRIGNDDQL